MHNKSRLNSIIGAASLEYMNEDASCNSDYQLPGNLAHYVKLGQIRYIIAAFLLEGNGKGVCP